MFARGLAWMTPFIQRLALVTDRASDSYSELPLTMRESFLPFALACFPAMLLSLFAPPWLMPVCVILTLYLVYEAGRLCEGPFFAFDRSQAHLRVMMPLYGFMPLWGLLLAAQGKPSLFLTAVCPLFFAIIYAVSPALRYKLARKQRRIPFAIGFKIVAALVVLSQVSLFWRLIK